MNQTLSNFLSINRLLSPWMLCAVFFTLIFFSIVQTWCSSSNAVELVLLFKAVLGFYFLNQRFFSEGITRCP